jgi:hypothetical protein
MKAVISVGSFISYGLGMYMLPTHSSLTLHTVSVHDYIVPALDNRMTSKHPQADYCRP